MSVRNLEQLFRPRSIAVIGASDRPLSLGALVMRNLRDAEIIVPIRERTRFTRDIIAQLPKLRLFSQTGRSCHHIDLEACNERGIAVAAGRHASPHTVAEQTWTLILASRRDLVAEATLMKRGGWRNRFSSET